MRKYRILQSTDNGLYYIQYLTTWFCRNPYWKDYRDEYGILFYWATEREVLEYLNPNLKKPDKIIREISL